MDLIAFLSLKIPLVQEEDLALTIMQEPLCPTSLSRYLILLGKIIN
jgi:hypothetical protein